MAGEQPELAVVVPRTAPSREHNAEPSVTTLDHGRTPPSASDTTAGTPVAVTGSDALIAGQGAEFSDAPLESTRTTNFDFRCV